MILKKINFWYINSFLISILVALPIITVFLGFFESTSDYFSLLKDTFLLKYISNSILLLFGGRKIPELMKGLGGGIKEFKKASKADPDEEDVNKTNQNMQNKGKWKQENLRETSGHGTRSTTKKTGFKNTRYMSSNRFLKWLRLIN